MPSIPESHDRLIDFKELKAMIPLSRMHIWRLERQGEFPPRLKLSARRVAWRLSAVLAWIETRPFGTK